MPASVPIELSPLGAHAGPSSTSLPPAYDDTPSSAGPSASSFPPPPRRTDVAPGGLGRGYRSAEEKAKAAVRPPREDGLDSASIYGLVVAGWFAILSLPLLLLPRLILFLAQGPEAGTAAAALKAGPVGIVPMLDRTRGQYDSLTALETYLVKMLGFGLVGTAALIVFAVVPAYTPPAPARKPSITVIAILTAFCAVVSWNAPLGALSVMLGLGNGIVSAWGWWALFFGEDPHKFKKYLKEDSRFKRL